MTCDDVGMLCIGLRALRYLSFGVFAATLCLSAKSPPKQIIAYVFVKDRVLGPTEIAANKLTRVNYAFANIENGEIVAGFAHDVDNFRVLNALKQQNPQLQVLVSVGGWTWSGAFSDMALTPESRAKFIASAVRFVRDNNLDGIDIDWEYPGSRGMGNTFRPEDKQNYTALMKELRQGLDAAGKQLGRKMFTSVATGSSADFLRRTEMDKVQRYVDSVNLMAYDYYEASSSPTTGHHSPLHANPADPKQVSTEVSVDLYRKAGVPAHKIVLGVPFYGHAWGEVADTNHGLFQPGKQVQLEANYNAIAGTLLNQGFVRYWDAVASAPFLYNASTHTFVSYEDPESLRLKCLFVLQHKLGGVMFWEYSGDADQALLNAINNGLSSAGPAGNSR